MEKLLKVCIKTRNFGAFFVDIVDEKNIDSIEKIFFEQVFIFKV